MRLAILSAALVPSLLLMAQEPEFQVKEEGYRSLRAAMWLLREKTGWHISYEEPIWPPKASPGPDARLSDRGLRVEPPTADRLQVSISSLRGTQRSDAVNALLGAYNAQNSLVSYKSESLSDTTVIEADTMPGPAGTRVPAYLILSTMVQIPVAQRTPTEHLEALANAIEQRVGIPVEIDTGLGPYDVPFTGKNGALTQRSEMLVTWGTQPQTARLALLDLLGHSKTTTVYEVACQVGINSPGECTLALRPLTVQVITRSGKLTKRTLYFDRGRPDVVAPPPPE